MKTSALELDAAWAKALYQALLRYEPTPLYEAVCAEHGRPALLGGAA